MKIRNLLLLVPLLAGLGTAPARAQLESSREKYHESLREISVEYTAMEAELIGRYLRSLNSLLDAQTKRGNLEYVLAIKKFIEQVNDPEPPEKNIPEAYGSLKRLHATYRSELQRLQNEKSTKIIALIKQYDGMLERLQRKLTLDGKIDDALAVREERQTLDWKSGPRPIETPEESDPDIDRVDGSEPPGPGGFPRGGMLVFQWDERKEQYRVPGRPRFGGPLTYTLDIRGDVDVEPYFLRIDRGQVLVEGLNQPLLEAARASNQLYIEAMLRSADLDQGGPARIITFSSGAGERNFTLGQEGDELVLRLRTDGDGGEATRSLCTIEEDVQHHVIVSYRDGLLYCFLDNELVLETDEVRGGFSNWLEGQHLVLGNEYGARRDWQGYLALIQVGTRFVKEKEARMRYKMAARKIEAIGEGRSPATVALPRFGRPPGFDSEDIRERLREARDGLQKTREQRGEN